MSWTSWLRGPKSWPAMSSAEKLTARKSVVAPCPSFMPSMAADASRPSAASANGLSCHAL